MTAWLVFTPHPEANVLIMDNPLAFLPVVIFDQGIPAERAWRALYETIYEREFSLREH